MKNKDLKFSDKSFSKKIDHIVYMRILQVHFII